MTYDEIILNVSASTGLSKTFVDKVYKAYWKAVREYIVALPLKGEFTEEDFKKIRPNVNIPSLGKLYVAAERFKKMKQEYNKFTEQNQ